jgi:hypothetical protein
MFDLVRASVNLVVSSILIAIGTSHKLPLSTTYVTFMVAMSTSLVDGAWGHDSAVYRITGVFSVVGGWFMTAMAAFLVALSISLFMNWAQTTGVIIMVALALFAIYRTNLLHRKRDKKKQMLINDELEAGEEKIADKCTEQLIKTYNHTSDAIHKTIKGLSTESKKDLKQALNLKEELEENIVKLKSNTFKTVQKLAHDKNNHNYIQLIDWQNNQVESLAKTIKPVIDHIDNHHKPLTEQQIAELKELDQAFATLNNLLITIITEKDYGRFDEANELHFVIIEKLNRFRSAQIERINNKEVGNRNTNLFFTILQETQRIVVMEIRLLKIYTNFISDK